MVTTIPLVSVSSSAALGRSTSAAGFTIAEVVIMKMMSSTRKTSVSGVTLISATMWPRVCALNSAIGPPRRRHRLEKPRTADAQRAVDPFDAVLEVVVEDERHDADGEPERGGDQSLGDAARHHPETPRPDQRHAVEGAHDPDDRPEETDEGCRRSDRSQHPQIGPTSLDLLELPFIGDALELRQRLAGRRREHVAEDAPGGAGAVSPDGVRGALDIATGEQRYQLGGERGGGRDHAAQAPQALEDDTQHDHRADDQGV